MRKVFMISVLAILLCGCGSKDVIKKGEGTYTNQEGEKTTAKVTYKNDKLTEVSIDESTKDTTKRALKDTYEMKKASTIGKEWYEQMDYLQTYIKDNGIKGIKLDEQGKATNDDVKSGCTMSIDGYIKAVDDAMKNAKEVDK